MWYKYAMGYYSAVSDNEISPFETAWKDLESITLSEISLSQRKTNTIWFHLFVEPKRKPKQMNKQNRNRPIDIENKLTVAKGEVGAGNFFKKEGPWLLPWPMKPNLSRTLAPHQDPPTPLPVTCSSPTYLSLLSHKPTMSFLPQDPWTHLSFS